MKNLDIYGWIMVALAALMLLCLLPMPYGFYTFVRFAAMVGFVILAFGNMEKGSAPLAVAFGALALLFQPFAKIALGRTMWNIVDVAVAIFLVIMLVKSISSAKS